MTDYNIYCGTKTLNGIISPFHSVMERKFSMSTSCCKLISVSINQNIVQVNKKNSKGFYKAFDRLSPKIERSTNEYEFSFKES